ncbi:ABC transporter permease [Aestuariivirga litoralis]|uniref:ABC transporter permease n=1 Tax=Aestuariivirga litoralis TaxID=2650924 RepID=A0A2W2APE4_9HYPH|nr:FtsX-like permease family protein [Aestuariivirga litoralis]PZF77271.1 ABC transporter permease [Aestuariivirga litoralis]
MNPSLWLRFALRDLRSGLQGFWIFLTCLALGTGTIAIIGALSASIERGIDEQGQPLLGGDLEFSLIHQQASQPQRDYIASRGELSEVATVRGMALTADNTALVEVKAVDGNYPLYGRMELEGGLPLADAIATKDGVPGAAADPLLLGRLGIKLGDSVKLGNTQVQIRALIRNEPDRLSDTLVLGPRLMISPETLAATGIVQPGSLVTYRYRVKLAENSLTAAKAVEKEAEAKFKDAGWRIRTRNNAAAGADGFVERLGYFMTLVGLASLIVGGAGIANAVQAFVTRKMGSIATLKCLGASSADVMGIYLTEIILVALIAIALGLAAGAIAPPVITALFGQLIPVPLSQHFQAWPLVFAGLLGLLTTLAFALWPLAHARQVAASALFRSRIVPVRGWPGTGPFLVILAALALMAALTFYAFENVKVTAYFLGGLVASFVVLLGLARLIITGAERLPRSRSAIWRYAVGNIYRPGSAAASVILALGLGLTLFVTLALTDRSISKELLSSIPERAPAFFFLDVPNGELATFKDGLMKEQGVTHVNNTPMLRGRVAAVKGVPAEKVKASPESNWALRGDRGITYAAELPEGSRLVAGEWWPADYSGPPLVSLVDEIANGIGVKIGDEITVNVLGRDITAKVANLRAVNWRSLGINFVMVFTPSTLKAAPHNHLVTVEMKGGDEAKLLNAMARAYPSVTAVRVKDAIDMVSGLLEKMLVAIRGANILTLLTGMLVLAGALAAGLSERLYEAVVLKTYGASKRQLVGAFVIEYAGLGLAAAAFGLAVGSAASWFLSHFILEIPWSFSGPTAVLTALLAMAVTVAGGLAVTWRALSAKPGPLLRNE